MLPTTVRSARLELPLWGSDVVAAVRGGEHRPEFHAEFPREDDRDAASMWHEDDRWGPRSITVLSQEGDGLVVGSIGFFGPPSPASDGVAETEVGYGLVEPARGHGYATEALGALLAAVDAERVRIRASVAPDNQASIRVLAKTGFTELRGSNEDGHLVMARPLRA
jgi:[ribosomal protein S5]-alanine N-acetyltransferase